MEFLYWHDPNSADKKRIEDLTSKDLAERHFFEMKFREFKRHMEDNGKQSAISIKTALIPVASFLVMQKLKTK